MIIAHVVGVPLEELLALAPGAGACWLALRTRARAALKGGNDRRREDD